VQLETPNRPSALRETLNAAALALLLVPAAGAETAAATAPTDQIDFTTLFYGEESRTQVVEPVVRATRLFPDGQSLSCQIGIDVITGASPSGALPSGSVQTHTSSSGKTTTTKPGEIPTVPFQDRRLGLDGEWTKPLNRFLTSTLAGHVSREKDYQSLGLSGKLSVDLMQRLLTVTAGAGYNHDSVFPVGGTPDGLSDGTVLHPGKNSKEVTNLYLGVSRVLTRKWLVGLDGSHTDESGYLTEPYKLITLENFPRGVPMGEVTDNRPSSRVRNSVLASSVYHLTSDVIYTSYRYYRDTWQIRSNTVELKYRYELTDGMYLEPLGRYYQQTAASFFTVGLIANQPLPEYATADYRLGELQTETLGATLGFRLGDSPAEWTLRGEYIRQNGDSHPASAIGVQQNFNLSPTLNIFALVLGVSFNP
jgi:hypothetical protein